MAPSSSDLPSAADHSERLNRMNMVLAKHASTLAALKRSKPSTSFPATGGPKQADRKKGSKSSSFSALKISAAASGPDMTAGAASQRGNNYDNGGDDDDDDNTNFGSANAGIGFVPAGKEIAQDARSAATRDLRGKLLGKRAREQKEDAAAARKKKNQGRMDDDDSDEDEGRSKIGKGRKKRAKAKEVEEDD